MSSKKDIKFKFKSIDQVVKAVNNLTKIILFSRDKKKITHAFEVIDCIVKGKCICDLCDTWDPNIYIVFEFGRCLFPTQFFQLLKETYINTDHWKYIQPLYTKLYNTLYEDILPETTAIASLDQESSHLCQYKLSNDLIKRSIINIKKIKMSRLKKNTKKKRKN